jgi:hypothetical protein
LVGQGKEDVCMARAGRPVREGDRTPAGQILAPEFRQAPQHRPFAFGVEVGKPPGGVWFRPKPNLEAPDRFGPRGPRVEFAPMFQEDVSEGERVAERARAAHHDAIGGQAPALGALELDPLGHG